MVKCKIVREKDREGRRMKSFMFEENKEIENAKEIEKV